MALDTKTEVYKVLNTYGQQVVKEMRTRLINAGKVASGKLLKSLDYEIEIDDEAYELHFLAESYVDFVDKGRKPGKMPPIEPIKKWLKVKGLPEEMAFPVAKNIGKFGIPPTNFFTISVTRREKQLYAMLEKAVAKDAENAIKQALK